LGGTFVRIQHFAALLASTALIAATPSYAGASSAADAAARTAPTAATDHAKAALARVQEAFAPKALTSTSRQGRGRPTPVVGERVDATMALRDLLMLKSALSPADRAEADRYFHRPTDPGGDPGNAEPYSPLADLQMNCGTHICVHYDATSIDEDYTDPTWAQHTLDVAEHVWETEVTNGGYLAPKSDITSSNNGGDGRLDIYLANEADNGLYGYCTSDDPTFNSSFRISAYCVVDNDFAEYARPGDPSLFVTVAHEFFHAVQFNYEWDEDAWFMEGTAAWMEDEVYDSINDNMIYLAKSWKANTLLRPDVPLDKFSNSWPNYGTWTFWKKLSERFPTKQGGLPAIVKEVWTAAIPPSTYSTKALSKVLARHNTSFASFFTRWGVGNRFPGKSYAEGRANHYPKAPLASHGRFKLSKKKRNLGEKFIRLNHLTNATSRFTPDKLTGKHWKLRVTVDGPDKLHFPRATLVVYKRTGAIVRVPVHLNRHGVGAKRVSFGLGKVKYVELTLTNASNRFRSCWKSATPYSCSGVSKDDKQLFKFNARVLR
jgi:hypothetical protein